MQEDEQQQQQQDIASELVIADIKNEPSSPSEEVEKEGERVKEASSDMHDGQAREEQGEGGYPVKKEDQDKAAPAASCSLLQVSPSRSAGVSALVSLATPAVKLAKSTFASISTPTSIATATTDISPSSTSTSLATTTTTAASSCISTSATRRHGNEAEGRCEAMADAADGGGHKGSPLNPSSDVKPTQPHPRQPNPRVNTYAACMLVTSTITVH